ncbi:unnamed protein product [Musa acuminata var. zebrina]
MRRKKKASVGGADRPYSHRRSRGGDLFFCFGSRPSAAAAAPSSSSSSAAAAAMRAPSSKSLLSPGRGRDPAAAPFLSSSLSRRLRNSGSVKGAQSPMFPTVVAGRRKGVAFEAAEPSSPKVTCIGQVRVKSKKKKAAAAAAAAAAKGKASVMRSRSMRGSGREASFRRTEDMGGAGECLPSRNQRWVYHLPVSICEALRAFGSEFNCFFPCGGRSLCSSSSSSRSAEGREGGCGERRSNSCGAVFARWLMAVPDTEEGNRREIVGVAVEDGRDREMGMVIKERLRREDLEFGIETEKTEEVVMVVEKREEKEEEEEEEARVSICIPPRNALLLMRCRSDPVRMAALASRFWDSPAMQVRVEEEDADEEEDGDDDNRDQHGERNEEVRGEERDDETAQTAEPYREEEGVEESHQGVILSEELMKASDGTEAQEEEVKPNPVDERQNKDEDLITGTAAEPVEAIGNSDRDKKEQEVEAAEVEFSQLKEKPEEKEMTNDTPPKDREVEKEEDKGRRTSSCSSTADKEERRSNRLASKSKEGSRRHSSALRERDKRRHSFSTEREVGRPSLGRPSFGGEKEVRRASFSIEAKGRWSFSIEKDGLRLEEEVTDEAKKTKKECFPEKKGPNGNMEVQYSHTKEKEGNDGGDKRGRKQCGVEREAGEKGEEEKKGTELPDCLLLMMYEPKLSMEVSKETWVCSTDFLQWRLHHPNYRPCHPSKPVAAGATATTTGAGKVGTRADEVTKGEASVEITDDRSSDNKETVSPIQEAPQPSSLPSPPVLPTVSDKDKKLRGNAGVLPSPAPAPAYGPFVLTRCKSEPMRSSAKMAPDACFWKDRHRPIGATGIGF